MAWRNRLLGLLGASFLVSGVEAAPIVDPIPAAIAKGGVVVELETIAAGLAAPNALTHAGDGSDRLFYSDLATGLIQELVLGLDDRDLLPFVLGFGEDASGELYLLSAAIPGPFFTTGLVRRIVPALPEPSLALLMMCGTIGLGIRQRRASTFRRQ